MIKKEATIDGDPFVIGDYSSGEIFWSIHDLQRIIHRTAVEHGWWDRPRGDLEVIMLMVTELSEAVEWLRQPKSDVSSISDHIAPFKGVEEELADVIIRILDYAAFKGYDVPGALIAKVRFNDTRPYRHGGKVY